MLRRDLLKIVGLAFVPVPGLAMSAPRHGRITLSFQDKIVIERPIEYRLNSTMTIRMEAFEELVTFDGCGLYRPGDAAPFLHHSFEFIRLGPQDSLGLTWSVHETEDGALSGSR